MLKEYHLPQAKVTKKLTSSDHSMRSCHEVLERELLESLNKTEHRAEILIAISHTQRKSGWHELAEAYRKQGMSSKAKAQSIRKLLAGKESTREEE